MSLFGKVKNTINLLKSVDMNQLAKISETIDLPEAMDALGNLDERQLKGLMKMLKTKKKMGQHNLPPIDGDFYNLDLKLSAEQRELQLKVRNFMEDEVKPLVNDHWNRAKFPFEIIEKFAKLNIAGVPYEGYGCPHLSFLMEGIIAQEIARVDVSISTFFGVHSGLAMGSIYICGSEAQKEEWLPQMQRMEKIGAFGLTEPNVGSGVSQGLEP